MTTKARGNSQRRSGGSPGSFGFTAGATRSDLTAEGNRRASVAPNIGWPLGRTLSPYGLALSVALGGASDSLGDGISDGIADGSSDGLGDGDGTAGKAFAITVRIFAMVAAFRYAG
jgi:hypothetical protein